MVALHHMLLGGILEDRWMIASEEDGVLILVGARGMHVCRFDLHWTIPDCISGTFSSRSTCMSGWSNMRVRHTRAATLQRYAQLGYSKLSTLRG